MNRTYIKLVYFGILLLSFFSDSSFAQCGSSNIIGTGTKTWTAPAGTTSVTVQAWGGGGGGGEGTGSRGAGGGGGGAYASSTLVVVPGVTYTIVVGAGGASATDGGNSSFGGALVVAAGGKKGTLATSSSGATGQGAGGTVAASVGTIRYAGGNGGGASNNDGGGGGGAAGAGGTGGNGGNGCSCSSGPGGTWGEGGTSGQGRGGRGGSDSPDSVAVCGFAPGGGGGGAEDESGEVGGVGGAGQVILTYTSAACPSGVSLVYSGSTITVMTSANSKTICSGANVNIALRSSAGSKFTWKAAANGNVTGESTTQKTTATINDVLTNTTSSIQTVTYSVTPVPTCNNSTVTQVVTVVVNPLPTMTSANTATICSGQTVSIPLTSSTDATAPSTFTWIAANNANTTGESTTAQVTSTLSNVIVNNTTSNQTVTYTVTPTNSCGAGTAQVVSVLVKPAPSLSSTLTPAAICSGSTFTYTATSAASSPSFSWRRATVANISQGASSGTGNVSETLTNTSTSAVNVTYSYTVTSSGCSGSQNVVVAVNPGPSLSSTLTPTPKCSGASVGYTPTSSTPSVSFAWSRSTVANITEAANSGTGNITETLTNTSASPVIVPYTYTLTAGGCSGVQTITVTVNPIPRLSSATTASAICSGSAFTYTATSSTSGTSFSWTRPAVTGISNAAVTTPVATHTVSETLTNTSASSVDVKYVFSLTASSCVNTQTVTVTVKPKPQLSSSLSDAICSGNNFSYQPASATSSVSFSWTRAAVANINGGASASGTGNIAENLTNSTTSPLNTAYSYTSTANGCTGTPQTLTVTVNPIPTLSSTLTPASICSGSSFTYTPTSATSGATFSWSRAAVAGISEGAASGTVPVNEVLTNSTASVVSVTYAYITTANGCSSPTQNVVVGVKPIPSLSSTLTPNAICSGTAFTYTATSNTAGTTFAWSRAAVTGISQGASSGTTHTVSETLSNTTSDAINVTYVITPTYLSCSGSAQNVVVSVNPSPQGNFYGNTVCISALTDTKLTFSATAGTGQFDLVYDAPADPGKTENNVDSNTPFNSDPLQTAVGTYTYTLTSVTDANGCIRTSGFSENEAVITVTSGTITADPSTPASTTTCSGVNADFYVNATGVQSYSWEVNTSGANGGIYDETATWTAITGAETSPTYTGITSATLGVHDALPAHDGYRYRAQLSPACGFAVTSSIARLTVNTPPVLSSNLAPTPATCSGEPVNYTPTSSSSDAEFSWSRAVVAGISNAAATGTGAISETLTNTTVNPVNVTYIYTITDTVTTCQTIAQNVIVTINPAPVLSSMTGTVASKCSPATFTYTPTSESINATFAWSRATITGITEAGTSNSGTINETLTNTTSSAIDVTYTITTTAYTCSGPAQTIVVTVNPAPVLSSTSYPSDICTGVNNFTYTATSATSGVTFEWSRAAVTGISEAANSGTDNDIAETLTNTTSDPKTVLYTFTVTASGCTNVTTQTVSVIVRPSPVLSSTLTTAVCSGSPLAYSALSATSNSSFAWSRAAVAGISNLAGSGTGDVNEVLTNTTTSPVHVYYTYTVTSNSCVGPAQNVDVTVNPAPTITSSTTDDVCSKTEDNYNYFPTSDVLGATYSWTRATVTGISQAGTSGTGNISEILTNTTADPVNVTYVITPSANGCSGSPTNIVVSVKPGPSLSSSATQNVCSGTALNYTANSETAGASFSWSRAAVAGITEAASSGTSNPLTETLTNTTTFPIDVQYVYTTSKDGCVSSVPDTLTVTVNPIPTMTSATSATICTGNSLATNNTLTFASDVASTYAWTRANTASIGPAGPTSGSSNPVSEVLTNATSDDLTTTYVVTPTSTGGNCAGDTQDVDVTVTPLPAQPNSINGNPN